MFHLGWFMNFSPQGWGMPGRGRGLGYGWDSPEQHIDMVKALERGCFDLVLLEDSDMVPEVYGGTSEVYLKYALETPKFDPVAFVSLLAHETKHIGIVATATTTFYPPFLLARLFATLDHISGGRVGWNIVTATNNQAAQNYGLDTHIEHDLRYEIAEEYVDLVMRLWHSWEQDAVVEDEDDLRFADFRKVHPVDFEGKHFRSRGPLNVPRTPQGRPVIAQAGGSPKGRAFAAKNAEVIVAGVNGADEMIEYVSDVRARMRAEGRDPSSCKILFCATPIIADTDEEARRQEAARRESFRQNPEAILAEISTFSNIDFSKFDLDAPVPQLTTNGSQGALAMYQGHGDTPLRDVAAQYADPGNIELIGSADTVAERMGDIVAETGADGYLIASTLTPRYVGQIVDELVPALQRRGLMRTSYDHPHFRDNLLQFLPSARTRSVR